MSLAFLGLAGVLFVGGFAGVAGLRAGWALVVCEPSNLRHSGQVTNSRQSHGCHACENSQSVLGHYSLVSHEDY